MTAKKDLIRVGEGAGATDAWISPARDLALRGRLDFLTFECLAERSISYAQLRRLRDPELGYDQHLVRRMEAVLGPCLEGGTRIVSNMGAANPGAAGRKTLEIAGKLGLPTFKLAVVHGDDVLQNLDPSLTLAETGLSLGQLGDRIVSANAYLGSDPIVAALDDGAQVVLTGRVADPSLLLSCLRHSFGWAADDWATLGAGLAVGHLMECGPHVTGGYFSDPGVKDVPHPEALGSPIAECRPDGTAVITKLPDTGGRVDFHTCAEQLLYEIHDPASYPTADVTADFSQAELEEVGPNRVLVRGATGRERPARLKVSVGYRDGYIGEAQISYAGTGCVARGRQAGEIVADRLEAAGLRFDDFKIDLIGCNALAGDVVPRGEPSEVRVRIVGRCQSKEQAEELGIETMALWLCGPAGGGGGSSSVREVVAIGSVYLERERVPWSVETMAWPGA